jgi:alginate O-acetyltransferase complex protein AlgI
MVFSSITFLFVFLPATLLLYFVAPRRARNVLLLLASLLYYAWGAGGATCVLLLSVVLNYLFGVLASHRGQDTPRAHRRAAVFGSALCNLAILGHFKYSGFLAEQINAAAELTGRGEIAWFSVALPIGISFYTFQSMSYVFDIARGKTKALRNPLDFALYVACFPQLIAGPIVRFHEIRDQLRSRCAGLEDVAAGATRFSLGLIKKVVIADSIAVVARSAFDADPGELTTPFAWLGLLAYTLQIYFDFSGYSDMAIGLGRMFGFRFPENFRRPYSALSVTDFWRRWHMTLSGWFRDYLYIPLGGSRVSVPRLYANLVIVFLLVGLWHGANWTFIAWGAYHGMWLILERTTSRRFIQATPYPALKRAATFFVIMLGWVLFRATDIQHALAYYRSLFEGSGWRADPVMVEALSLQNLLVLGLASMVVLLPRGYVTGLWLTEGQGSMPAFARIFVVTVGLACAGLLVMAGTFSPFLYYQF